jgi:hypothetical protein
VESLLFQSAMPPSIAVRLFHVLAVAAAAQFHKYSGKQLRWWVVPRRGGGEGG